MCQVNGWTTALINSGISTLRQKFSPSLVSITSTELASGIGWYTLPADEDGL